MIEMEANMARELLRHRRGDNDVSNKGSSSESNKGSSLETLISPPELRQFPDPFGFLDVVLHRLSNILLSY